jgi:hypothetical protein
LAEAALAEVDILAQPHKGAPETGRVEQFVYAHHRVYCKPGLTWLAPKSRPSP